MKVSLYIGNKNYSSWSLRAWFLLREAGIEFDEHLILLDEPDSAKNIAAVSESGMVPLLKIDDLSVWDSLAIAETVAERWPDRNLWPADPDARARARSISAEMHSGFAALRRHMPLNCRAMGRKVPLPDELAADIDRVMHIWTDCRRHAGAGEWLFGHFTVADAMYAPVVLRFRTYGINLPESAAAYANRVLESPAMQDWLAAAETEVEVIDREEIGR